MVKRALVIGLLGISLAVLPINEAYPATCAVKQGGTCLVWTGSVICGIQSSGVQAGYQLSCSATGTDQWLVVCENQGGNEAPGINLATFSGTLTGIITLTNADITRNGVGSGLAVAEPTQSLLTALSDAGVCPNPNWIVTNALPVSMTVRDMTLDEFGCVISDAYYTCNLPNPETLQYDSATQTFEQRQYECTQTGRNNYRIPQYPDGSNCP